MSLPHQPVIQQNKTLTNLLERFVIRKPTVADEIWSPGQSLCIQAACTCTRTCNYAESSQTCACSFCPDMCTDDD